MSGLESCSHLGALAAGILIAGLGPAVPAAVAAPTAMVELGQASTYAVLSGASVGNTVDAAGAPHTTLRGDLGVSANAEPTGFPPGDGTKRHCDGRRYVGQRPRTGPQRSTSCLGDPGVCARIATVLLD